MNTLNLKLGDKVIFYKYNTELFSKPINTKIVGIVKSLADSYRKTIIVDTGSSRYYLEPDRIILKVSPEKFKLV